MIHFISRFQPNPPKTFSSPSSLYIVPILKLVREIPTNRVLLTFSSTHRPNTSINTPSIHTNPCSTIKWCTLFGMECDNSVICTFTEVRKSYSCFEMTTRLTYGNVHFTHIIQTYTRSRSKHSIPPTVSHRRPYLELVFPPTAASGPWHGHWVLHTSVCQWPSYLLLLKSQSPQVYTLSRHS